MFRYLCGYGNHGGLFGLGFFVYCIVSLIFRLVFFFSHSFFQVAFRLSRICTAALIENECVHIEMSIFKLDLIVVSPHNHHSSRGILFETFLSTTLTFIDVGGAVQIREI